MAILNFTLNPEAVGKFNNAIVCLGRFSDSVSIECNRDQLILSTLNSTKSAYASFTFTGSKFFVKYSYSPPRMHGQQPKEKFACRIYNKALLSVFKWRAVDPAREKDTAIEKCDVSIEDGAGEAKSRFIVRMTCRHGVLKTYRLTFESEKSMHALFHPEHAKSHWAISSKVLREFVDHFRTGTEQLDIYSENGRASFTSYTEKITAGNEILKQPLHTTVVIDTLEFSEFSVEEKQHIVISVKDFKAIVTHAGILNTTVSARYSHPSKPIQLKYRDEGLVCEFILMTIGDPRENYITPIGRDSFSKPASRQHLEATLEENRTKSTLSGLSLPRPVASNRVQVLAKSQVSRPSPPLTQPSLKSDTLFFPEYDDDQKWEPMGEDDEETLGWDMSTDHEVSTTTLSRGLQQNQSTRQIVDGHITQVDTSTQRLEPTQKISQIRGFFED